MKKKIWIPIVLVLCLVGAACLAWSTLESNVFSAGTLPAKTTVNGIDCSGLTIDAAKDKLIKKWNSNSFSFTQNGRTLGSIDSLRFRYAIDDSLRSLTREHIFRSAANYFFHSPLDLTLEMTVAETGKSFDKALRKADYLKEEPVTKTKDAYVDLSTENFTIVPEVYGNNIDYDRLTKKITGLVAAGHFTLEYAPADFHQQPKVTADSDEIKERQAFCKKYLTSKVTYIMGKKEVKIPPASLEKIFNIELVKSGEVDQAEEEKTEKAMAKITINEDAVREFVEDFRDEYNTLGKTRKFTSFSGRKIEVSGGDYGYAISADQETEQLIKDLKSGKEIRREPKWLMTGFVEYDQKDDIGDTYVEVSLSEQHLWYFKNGRKIVDCPVVTGNINQGFGTPSGTFSLSYKQRGATLKGANADGSSYESPVSYWMPFYGNYGMHDAPWRGAFGGSIYRGNGSHGCVNMPVAAAGTLFNNLADKGVPIILHW